MLRRLRSLSRATRSRRHFDQAMTEEFRMHLERYTDDLVRSGVPPREAARRARIEFGSLIGAREEGGQARGLRPFDGLARQLRHAARSLRKAPAFTAAALVTLAVCLGANLTIFAAVEAILLRPLPFPRPDGSSPSLIPIPRPASIGMAPRRPTTTSAAARFPLSPGSLSIPTARPS